VQPEQEQLTREFERKAERLEQVFQQLRTFRRSEGECAAMIRNLERERDKLHADLMRMNSNIMPTDLRDETPIEDENYEPEFEDPEWRH
jgi:uncharacterized protein Yka (UPF0111/DUF47 family)